MGCKNMQAVEGLQILLSFVRAFQKEVVDVCEVFSSRDIVQLLSHAKSLNVKQLLTSAKLRKVFSTT